MTKRIEEIKARLEAATMGRHEAQQCLAQCALGSQNCHACPALGCGDNMAHGGIEYLLARVERLNDFVTAWDADQEQYASDADNRRLHIARAALEEEE